MADQSLHSPIKPHFFKPLLPGFRTHLNIPVAFFSKQLEGRNDQNKTAKLRSDTSEKTWLVKLDGLKLTDGWEDFAFAHDLRTGDIVVFRHEGEMVFHVTALGPSCCEIQYTCSSSHNINDGQTNIASRNNSRVKKNPRKKVESSSNHSCFVAKVSAWDLRTDQLYIPLTFARLNGLNKMRGKKIYLHNEEGRSWKLALEHDERGMRTYVKSGWRSFCAANEICQGQYTFKMVPKSAPPVLRLCRAKPIPKQISESKSASDRSCFEGFVNPSSLSNDQLVGTWKKPVLSLCPVESNRDKTPVKWSEGSDDVKPEESEEESNEDKNISQQCLEIKKRKYWSRCRASVENMDGDQTNIGVKKNPRKKIESSSDHSSLVANVTASSLRNDRLYLPMSFARSNGLDKMSGKRIVLLDEEGRSWKLNLKYNKADMHTFVRPGWTRFCAANGMTQGQQYTFELVQKSEPPVMRFFLAEHRPKSESSSHHSCFGGSVTASSLKKDKLYICRSFVSSNGLDKGCNKIVLKNEQGRGWTLVLKHYESHRFTILRRGWTSFCQDNGLKAGDSFKFKLVETGEKPILSLCPADSNRDKTPLVCAEGSDDIESLSSTPSSGDDSNISEESEEESIEDKNISQDYLEIKKRKYFSSCRASTSYTQSRFVTLTLTPSAFQTYKLFLPRGFTQLNGINKPRKITLLGQDGVKRVVDLYQENSGGTMRFGKGWREFCEAQGVKIDESFVLELVWEDEACPVLKFCTKVNSA